MKRVVLVLSLAAAAPAAAGKSSQVRPTPSPVGRPALRPGELVLTPEAVYANYTDTIDSGLPGLSHRYDIKSAGLIVHVQYGLSDRLHVDVGLEGYRKFGTITGPSVGDPSKLVEAHVLGWAAKVGAQIDVRLWERLTATEGQPAGSGDAALFVFVKALGDLFRQDQNDPFAAIAIAENALVYRAGAAAYVHLTYGLFLAPFAGVEGFAWSGDQTEVVGGRESRRDISGSELPYPFFGGDLLWAPPQLGTDLDSALSLAAIVALASEDDSGYGGNLFTLSLGWSFTF